MIPQSLTPEQADLWVAGYVVAYLTARIDAGDRDPYTSIAPILTNTLKLTALGRGIEKTAYSLPSGRQVLKLQRDKGLSLTKEQRAMDHCREQGLPVPAQHLLHPQVALAECCPALSSLSNAQRNKLDPEYNRVRGLFAAVGMGDQHDGNFGVREDGSIVAIDIGFGLVGHLPTPAPAPAAPLPDALVPRPRLADGRCDCDACRRGRAKEEIRAAIAAQRAAIRAQIHSQARRDVGNITGLGDSDPDDPNG